jgi:DNA end-binding protein Ku
MSARAIWKAAITLPGLRLPVRMYSAVEDRNVHFHLLHDQDMVRVQQRLVNPRTGNALTYQEARRGAEVESGTFVMLNQDELAELEPPASRDIEVVCFLEPEVIDHRWYERPYYLGPDGREEVYFAMVEALQRKNREGLLRWVMRRKRYIGALRAEGDYLMLITLRYENQVIPASALEPPLTPSYSAKETKMAEQLIAALADRFDPGQYRDEYREQVLQLVEAKRKGERIKLQPVEQRAETDSLEEVLRASLQGSKAGR